MKNVDEKGLYVCPIAYKCEAMRCTHREAHKRQIRRDIKGRIVEDYCRQAFGKCPDCKKVEIEKLGKKEKKMLLTGK